MAHLNRTGEAIGPSVTYITEGDPNVHIATKDEFIEVDGVRRLFKAGSTIPAVFQDQVEGEVRSAHDVRNETIVNSVDEDASVSQAERTGVDAPTAEYDDSTTKELTKQNKSARRSSGSRSGSDES